MQAFHRDPADVAALWEWYSETLKALGRYERDIVAGVSHSQVRVDDMYFGLTLPEIADRFLKYRKELAFSASIAMTASVEAAIRNDYHSRARQKLKDPLSRSLREVFKKRK